MEWHLPCSDWGVSVTARLPIAFVLSSFEPGGTERQMIELIRRLDRSRWKVHVACFHARGGWFGRVVEVADSVEEFPLRSFKHPSTIVQMQAFARWCRGLRIAVVHTSELYANIFGLPGAALARVPVRIANRREINPDKSPVQIAMQRAAYALAGKVVANSQAAADRLLAERVPPARVAVIPNGLDLGHVRPQTVRDRYRKVIVVANLRTEKGHDVLMDAAVNLLIQYPDATFELVGGGAERERLQARAATLGLTHAFSFLGHRDDVAARLAAADIFVLPSRSEAFPNALLEAMAAGLPVVASSVGGILELVRHERNGLLTPAGDAGALARQIGRLMADPALAARLGATARSGVADHYSFDRMVAAFENLYLTELTRRGVVGVGQPRLAA
jgi:glycosyltransferase involved in cell wall biosynthesis